MMVKLPRALRTISNGSTRLSLLYSIASRPTAHFTLPLDAHGLQNTCLLGYQRPRAKRRLVHDITWRHGGFIDTVDHFNIFHRCQIRKCHARSAAPTGHAPSGLLITQPASPMSTNFLYYYPSHYFHHLRLLSSHASPSRVSPRRVYRASFTPFGHITLIFVHYFNSSDAMHVTARALPRHDMSRPA